KNVSCLRCGAPRSNAAIVVDQSFPSPMAPPPADFNMGPGSMANTPGPAPYGPGTNSYAAGAAFAQPPPQQYGMPTQMPGPGSGFPQMGGMTPGYAPSTVSHPSFGPAAQAAFSGAVDTQTPVQGQNGFYGQEQGQPDPFSFLSG